MIREAMARQKKAGIARIVLYRRERPVMIEPFDKGLLLTTLRYDKTVRKPDEIFRGMAKAKIDPELIELATHIIDKKQAELRPVGLRGPLRRRALLELIQAKQKGKKPPVVQAAERPANVVNLFDALKKSLAGDDDAAGEASRQRQRRRRPRKPVRKKPPPRRVNRPEERRDGDAGPLSRQARFHPHQGAARAPRRAKRLLPRRAAPSSFTSTPRGACITISGSSMTACSGPGR